MRILTLATLFPNAARPNFGIFVERQTATLAGRDDVEITVISPQALPPWPLSRHPRYRTLAKLPFHETWRGLDVYRPQFPHLPGLGNHLQPKLMVRAIWPLIERLHDRGFAVIAWTVDDPDRARELIEWGVDGITTHNVEELAPLAVS